MTVERDILQSDRSLFAEQARRLIVLGAPLVGSSLAQIAITTTDTLMIGWYDVTALAALSLAGPLFFIIFILGAGFGWAVLPMVASASELGDERQVRRVTRMGLWLSVLFALAATPLFLFSESILLAIGQAPDVSDLAGQYLRILGPGLLPALFINVLRGYLSALERTNVVLVVTLATALANVVMNYALVFGNLGFPELGIRGAGIASLVGNLGGALALAIYVMRKTPEYDLFRNPFRPDWETFGDVFRLGWPIGLTSLAEVGLFSASSVMMGWVGTSALAAHGVALQIASITFMVHVGLSQAITVRAGQAWGREDVRLLKSASLASLALSGIAAFLTIVAFLAVPDLLIGLFVDPDDPERPAILAIGASLLAVAALFQLVDAAQVMALGMLRGVQDTRIPMIMAVVSYWLIGIPVAYVLGFTYGLEGVGIWLGLTIGLACAGVMMQIRFWGRYARTSAA